MSIDHGPRGTTRAEGLILKTVSTLGNSAASSCPLQVYSDAQTDGAARLLHEFNVKDVTGKQAIRELSQVQVVDQSRSMLLRTPQKRNMLYHLDTESGKTVSETVVNYQAVGAARDLDLQTLTLTNKCSQYQAQEKSHIDLSGIGGDGNIVYTFRYDPRMSTPVKVNKGNSRKYKSGKPFTAVATTQNGYTILGDADGIVRLYSDVSDKANALKKLQQYAMGDPVRGIDCTLNGSFVLWTTKENIYAVHMDGGDEQWDDTATPETIQLKLSPEHAEIIGETFDWVPAKFDLGFGMKNTAIIAYTGKYCVQWDMNDLLAEAEAVEAEIEAGHELQEPPCIYSASMHEVQSTVTDHTPLAYTADWDVAGLAAGIEHVNLDDLNEEEEDEDEA